MAVLVQLARRDAASGVGGDVALSAIAVTKRAAERALNVHEAAVG